jgi:tetratricopeptide (TPR) repeat protein
MSQPASSNPAAPNWRRFRIHAALFVLALVPRLLHLSSIAASSPFFTSPVVDAYTYTLQARAIAGGAWLDFTPGAFWQPPLYPWFLGAVHGLSADHFFVLARALQAALGALSCALLFEIGRRVFGTACGIAAGVGLALYGPAIYFDAQLLPASLALLFPLLLFLCLPDTTARWPRWLGVGLILGLGALQVPTILALAPCLALWLVRRQRAGSMAGAGRAGRLAALGGGVMLVLSPIYVRNTVIGDDPVLISWNGGVNFYLGNNADYPATTHIRPGQPWLDLMARANVNGPQTGRAAGQDSGAVTGSANSQFFYGEALRFIRTQPAAWLRLVGVKTWALLHGEEIGRNQSPYLARRGSPVLAGLMWAIPMYMPFGFVAPLALLGLGLALTRPGRPRLVAGFVLCYGAGVVLFFVTARYRMPIVPFTLLLAAAGGRALLDVTRRRRRIAIVAWVAVASFGVALNQGALEAGVNWEVEELFALGQAQIDGGQLRPAVQTLQRAVRAAPDDPDILFSLGMAYLLGGDVERAVPPLERIAAQHPERADVQLNLGNALFGNGRYARALGHYQAGLEIRPGDWALTQAAARAAARAGNLQQAIVHYRRWHGRSPDELEPCLALGYCYTHTASPDSARLFYECALRLQPTHLTALLESAGLLLDAGDLDEAAQHLERAARLYADVPRLDSLAAELSVRRTQVGAVQNQ